MSTEDKDPPRNIDPQAGADLLVSGVLEAINAALGIGATLAKTIAKETSRGNSVPALENGNSPLNEMVHYGVAAVTNVIGLVVSGVGVVSGSVKAPASTSASNAATSPVGAAADNLAPNSANPTFSRPSNPSLPIAHQGATLRIPLSIENPGSEAMNEINFTCLSLIGETEGSGQLLDSTALRFHPNLLSIAPKDFEKLTVFIETHPETALGLYTAVIGMGKDSLETMLQFRVVPAGSA